jgi:site-specific recombinase XerD
METGMNNPTINRLQADANGNKHLTAEQLEEVMESAMRTSARDHAMLLTIFAHALRASEASDLKTYDINWASSEMTIARKKGSLVTTQTLFGHRGKPALDEVKALKRWLVKRKRTNEPTSYVFASQKGGSLHPDVVNRIFKKYADRVNADRLRRGVQPISAGACHVHALKHTRLTLLCDAGMSIYRVSQVGGHAALSSTFRYVHGSQVLACKEAQSRDYEIFAA